MPNIDNSKEKTIYIIKDVIIMTLNEEKKLKSIIKRMVKESIFDIINGGMTEKKSSEKSKKRDSEDKRISDKKKKRILQALKDKKVDVAQYAYKLWPDKDKDSARSYFYKCLDGKTNDDGDVYSFNDEEFIRLESLLTNSQPNLE